MQRGKSRFRGCVYITILIMCIFRILDTLVKILHAIRVTVTWRAGIVCPYTLLPWVFVWTATIDATPAESVLAAINNESREWEKHGTKHEYC